MDKGGVIRSNKETKVLGGRRFDRSKDVVFSEMMVLKNCNKKKRGANTSYWMDHRT